MADVITLEAAEQLAENRVRESLQLFMEEASWRALPDYEQLELVGDADGWRSFGGFGSFARVYDRNDGRHLPFYEHETDLAILRQASRNLATVTSFGTSVFRRIERYVFRSGFEFSAIAKDGRNKHHEDLIRQANALIDAIVELNDLGGEMAKDIHFSSREDGEVLTVIHPQEDSLVPLVTNEEASCLQEPANKQQLEQWLECFDARNHWDFGVHTRYSPTIGRHYVEKPLGYHLIYDDAGSEWDYVPEARAVHTKRNVPARAKRGVPDLFFCMNDLLGEARLNLNWREGITLLAAIPYAKEVDKDANPVFDPDDLRDTAKAGLSSRKDANRKRMKPGTVPILRGAKYVPGPLSGMHTDIVEKTALYSLKRFSQIFDVPLWMITGDTETALYSAVLAIGSPFVSAREDDQWFYGRKLCEIITKALRLMIDAGAIPGITWKEFASLVEVTFEAPDVAITDRLSQAQADEIEIRAGIRSVASAQKARGLDPDEEAANIAKQAPITPAGDAKTTQEKEPAEGPAGAVDQANIANNAETVVPTESVRLNGTQIKQAVELIGEFQKGALTADMVKPLLMALGLTEAAVRDMLSGADRTTAIAAGKTLAEQLWEEWQANG